MTPTENEPYFKERLGEDEAVSIEGRKPAVDPGRWTTYLLLALALVPGLPVLWAYFTGNGGEMALLRVLGFAYGDLVYVFLLCIVTLIVSALILIRLKPVLVLAGFCLALFCAFPLVLGLRHHVRIDEMSSHLVVFESWPFFVHPSWLLSQILLPAGLMMFLYLYLRTLVVNRQNAWSFLYAFALICSAAVLSMSAMARADHPSLLSIVQPRESPLMFSIPMARNASGSGHDQPGLQAPVFASLASEGMPHESTGANRLLDDTPMHPMPAEGQSAPPPPGVSVPDPVHPGLNHSDLNHPNLERLEEKLDILIQLARKNSRVRPDPEDRDRGMSDFESQLRILAAELAYVSARLDTLEKTLPKAQTGPEAKVQQESIQQ